MNIESLEKLLTSLGPIGLTFVLVIAIGYLVRLVPVIKNRYIPLIAPVVGGFALPLLAPMTLVPKGWRNPVVVLIIWGVIVGVAAWAAHALIISRIEDWIRSKIPAVDRAFESTADKPKEPKNEP